MGQLYTCIVFVFKNISFALTKDLGDVGVVHVRTCLQDLPPLILGPYHEGVHGALDVRCAVPLALGLPDDLGPVLGVVVLAALALKLGDGLHLHPGGERGEGRVRGGGALEEDGGDDGQEGEDGDRLPAAAET